MQALRGFRAILAMGLLLTIVSSTQAKYGGGTGVWNDPYQIATAADLIALGGEPNDSGGCFILTADIDLDPNLDGRKVFDGRVIGSLTGTFDGNGHTISHLTIRGTGFYGSGLFAVVGSMATVTNLGVVDANIEAVSEGGGSLAGENRGTVTQCYSSGTVSGAYAAGGLVGRNDQGTVTMCYSTCEVRGRYSAGGLVGYSHGGVFASFAAGHVTAEQDTNDVGGIVGGGGSSDSSYSLAREDGGGPDNGLGAVLTDAQMRQPSSFADWDFYGSDADGVDDPWFMPPNSYPALSWQTEITGLRLVPLVIGLTMEQAQSRLEQAGFIVGEIQYVHVKGVTTAGVLATDPVAAHCAPLGSAVDIVFDVGPYDWAQNPGVGSEANPYQIQTVDHLDALREHPELWGKSFVLTMDIDLQGAVYPMPVIATSFAGHFDGNGHKIRNLVVGVSSTSPGARRGIGVSAATGPLGVFGTLAANARISCLGLENVQLVCQGGYTAGLLVGENQGTIVDCNTSGSVVQASVGGGLAGSNTGTISNCRTSASVSGQRAGGLVGTNDGTIADCHAIGEVTNGSLTMGWAVGGLVAVNRGSLVRCGATGSVRPSAWTNSSLPEVGVGGLVGSNSGSIVFCFATGPVQGSALMGGLVGSNGGSLTDSYATGSVSGPDYLGGLVGTNYAYFTKYTTLPNGLLRQESGYAGGTLTRCYSTGAVRSVSGVAGVGGPQTQKQLGGLVGSNSIEYQKGKYRYGTISSDSYFLAPSEGGGPDNKLGTALSLADMKRQASFSGWDFYGIASDGVADMWFMPPNSAPVLSWQTDRTELQAIPDIKGMAQEQAEAALQRAGFTVGVTQYDYDRTVPTGAAIRTHPYPYAPVGAAIDIILNQVHDWAGNPGDGTQNNPFQIATPGQLESLSENSDLWSRHFILTADIDMSGRTYPTALIGRRLDDVARRTPNVAFTGSFDGQGCTVWSLNIAPAPNVGGEYLGMFGLVGTDGIVRNLRLRKAAIYAQGHWEYIGLMSGCNQGTMTECCANGSAAGAAHYAGGLAGRNAGVVERCYADTSVQTLCTYYTGSYDGEVGGLVGENAGTIKDCYAVGSGLACNSGWSSLTASAGGLVGTDMSGDIEYCYAACSVAVSSSRLGGLVGFSLGSVLGGAARSSFWDTQISGLTKSAEGLGKNTTEMRTTSTFVGWDFTNTWTICEGKDYPRLQWEGRSCP